MKKSLAKIFGSFFLSPAALMLLGVSIIGTGCGSTPEPAATSQSTGEVTLFYSQSASQAEATPAILDDTNESEVIADSEENLPSQLEDSAISDVENSDYPISPHDVLRISVLGEDDLSVTTRVSERGAISFPLLGEVQVSGYTSLQFERRLEELLGKDYLVSPSVNISIIEYSTISVLGQVKKPGTFEIKGKMTISQAIAMAGGLTRIASPNGTKVIRKINGEKEVISVPLNDILKDGDLREDIPMKPGDLVVVPESFF